MGRHGLRFLPLPGDLGHLSHTAEWEAAAKMQEVCRNSGVCQSASGPTDE